MAGEEEEDGQQVQQEACMGEEAMDETKVETMTPKDFVDAIAQEGGQLLVKWHKMITKNPPKVDAFLEPTNTAKNRFPNILLYDRSRVKIKDNLGSDYYHASFVDSYDKIDGYVLAQAPFDDDTESDFWRVVYQERPKLIVLLSTLTGEDGRKLMRNFWPSEAKEERRFVKGYIVVRCNSVDQEKDSDSYQLLVMGPGQRGKSGLRTTLIHYKKWIEDKAIPDSLLEFRATVKLATTRAVKGGLDGPVCLVCPSGVHRCGTFAVLDIILDRLANERKTGIIIPFEDRKFGHTGWWENIACTGSFKRVESLIGFGSATIPPFCHGYLCVRQGTSVMLRSVGLLETVAIVRKQRYGCVTHFAHYNHVADLIVRQAISSGIVDPSCIGSGKKK
ncbi:Receptor-type tyrosine-protein phosphatase zeta [Toxocara canis]|uniref:Receptor-type tyrosine-protein phosphatase zeta n=1 Tax=Toxocara canis TaxID=6265 RepID=A0A0B2UYS1_TOXCA|nr:Receptor-type tyrosine-protein phosphatase zeta [Toxocara canis]